jgi:hypothetical protein
MSQEPSALAYQRLLGIVEANSITIIKDPINRGLTQEEKELASFLDENYGAFMAASYRRYCRGTRR